MEADYVELCQLDVLGLEEQTKERWAVPTGCLGFRRTNEQKC